MVNFDQYTSKREPEFARVAKNRIRVPQLLRGVVFLSEFLAECCRLFCKGAGIFAFMAYLGLRTGEAVGVAWEHLDLDADVLRVRQSNWQGKLLTVKSKASIRDLPLPPVLVEMLEHYQPRWRSNPLGLLFANAKGRPITSCYVRRDILHPIRERLGIARGGFHAFRHGLGTALMRAGTNPRVVQEQLGHADLSMLQRYAHVVPEDQRRAVERTTEVFLRRSAANANGKSFTIN